MNRWVNLGAMLALLSLGALASCGREEITVADVRSLLDQHLPNGTPHERVATVLDSLEVEHSPYDTAQSKITAAFRKASTRGMVTSDILVEFRFDNDGRLIQTKVEEVLTGP